MEATEVEQLHGLYEEFFSDDLADALPGYVDDGSWNFLDINSFGDFKVSTDEVSTALLTTMKSEIATIRERVRRRFGCSSNDDVSFSNVINLCLSYVLRCVYMC